MSARDRLAALAAHAGYSHQTLATIARATLPAYQPGAVLADDQIDQVADAVETLVIAGMSDGQVAELAVALEARDPLGWRLALWRHALRAANARHPAAAKPLADAA